MSPDDGLLTPPAAEFNPFGGERAALVDFVRLTRRKRELESELEEINPKLKRLGDFLRDYLADCGDVPPHVDGFTVYLQSQLWARKLEGVNMEQVCEALKNNGMAQFVKEEYSTQTLSKHMRELAKEHAQELATGELPALGDLLPWQVRRLLNIEPTYTVIAREIERKK